MKIAVALIAGGFRGVLCRGHAGERSEGPSLYREMQPKQRRRRRWDAIPGYGSGRQGLHSGLPEGRRRQSEIAWSKVAKKNAPAV